MIIMHDQDIENFYWLMKSLTAFGLELKLLGISFTPYCVNTGQIPVKTYFSWRFPSRVSSDRLRYDKKC